jgi:hypothetical protein
MTVVSDNLVELHTRIALLEALANHLRQCGLCTAPKLCMHGELLWTTSKIDTQQDTSTPSQK